MEIKIDIQITQEDVDIMQQVVNQLRGEKCELVNPVKAAFSVEKIAA